MKLAQNLNSFRVLIDLEFVITHFKNLAVSSNACAEPPNPAVALLPATVLTQLNELKCFWTR